MKFLSLITLMFIYPCLYSYDQGYDYLYDYETSVILRPPKSSLPVSYSIKSRLRVTCLRDEFYLKIETLNGDLQFSDETRQKLIDHPVKFDYKDGRVREKIWVDENESQSSLIFKKSVLNLFNYDSSHGSCNKTTLVFENSSDVLHFRNEMSNCEKQFKIKGEFKRSEKVLNSKVDRNVTTENLILKNILQNSTVDETLKVYNEFNPNTFSLIESKQMLRLMFVEKSERPVLTLMREKDSTHLGEELINFDLKINGLTFNPEEKLRFEQNFEKVLKKFSKKIRLGQIETSETFIKTIKLIRKYSNQKLLDKTLRNLIQKNKISKFLIEVYTASQTETSLNSLNKVLGIENLKTDDRIMDEKETKLIEDFLFSSALVTRKSKKIFKIVKDVNSNSNKFMVFDMKEKSALTLGSLSDPETRSEFVEEMDKEFKDCKTDSCKIKFLESLKNLKSQSILGFYEQNLNNCSNQSNVCLLSIKSLKNLDINLDLFQRIYEIFNSDSHPNELRLEALNFLVEKYSNIESILEGIVQTVSKEVKKNLKKNEFVLYVQKVLLTRAEFREKLIEKITLFDLLVQNGASNFMNNPIKRYPSGSLMYSLTQLMGSDGFFKSFDFAVSFQEPNGSRLDFLQFELYADNMNIMALKPNEKKDPTASVHLSIMGQKLKIVELFKSYSSMISLIWSLPTTPTSLFNLNFLTSDQNEYFFLSNGMGVRIQSFGTIGINMEGLTDISLWSQQAKINVKTQASLMNEQKLTLINDFKILNEIDTNLRTQVTIDFSMNTKFGSIPYKMCIKMSQDKFYLKESIQVVDSEFKVLQTFKHRRTIQASNFAFSKETIKFC